MTHRPTLCLIDGSSYFYRAFFAIRPLTTSKGLHVNAIYGFTTMVMKVLKELNPDYVAMIFDTAKKTFRNEIYPEYKANRTEMPKDLVEQIPYIKKVVDAFQIHALEKEGYEALQLGFEPKGKTFRHIKEFRNVQGKQDEEVVVSVFQEGEKVKISGISKGKGFQGAVKRHGFSGRNRTHGVKHEHRTLGSTGSRWPQHVRKGKKMPGRMGAERTSVRNAAIVKIDPERNLIAVKGAVPGARGTLLEIRSEA